MQRHADVSLIPPSVGNQIGYIGYQKAKLVGYQIGFLARVKKQLAPKIDTKSKWLPTKKQKAIGTKKAKKQMAIWLFGYLAYFASCEPKSKSNPYFPKDFLKISKYFYFNQLFGYLAYFTIRKQKSKIPPYFCIMKCYLAIWLIGLFRFPEQRKSNSASLFDSNQLISCLGLW